MHGIGLARISQPLFYMAMKSAVIAISHYRTQSHRRSGHYGNGEAVGKPIGRADFSEAQIRTP